MNKDIFLTNSLGNKKDKFIPINPKKISPSDFPKTGSFTRRLYAIEEKGHERKLAWSVFLGCMTHLLESLSLHIA